MKHFIYFILSITILLSQETIVQNGLITSVTDIVGANGTQARRFKIAEVSYNSVHWAWDGSIFVELYSEYYAASGYEKYHLNIGYGAGSTSTNPSVELIDSRGTVHNARIFLGAPTDLATSRGGYVNKVIPVYMDVRYYSRYRAKITHNRNPVSNVVNDYEIDVYKTPIGEDIPDFSVDRGISLSGSYFNSNISFGTRLNNKTSYIGNGSSNSNTFGGNSNWIGFVSSSTEDYLSFGTHKSGSSGGERMRIDSKGYVGIGTTNPSEKFVVKDGNALIDGTLTAEKIKVTSQVGADFVFEDDYDLRSLEKTEAFIKENKHLPEIPSAKDMKENGLDMSEFQIKLLQKIEELTLHLIKQNDLNKKQSKEIELLKNKIKLIEGK